MKNTICVKYLKETVRHWTFSQTYYVPDTLEDFNAKKGIRQNMMRTHSHLYPNRKQF